MVTNLLLFTNFICCIVEKQSQVDIIYLNFTKTFNYVNHAYASLLTLLKATSFGEPLLSLFISCLTAQYVKINNVKSNVTLIPSGVHQFRRAHLATFFCIIYKCNFFSPKTFLIFVVDMKIFHNINSSNRIIVLQSELDHLAN